VLDELGHGGMATVYRAHDKRLARDVAVKVLHPHLRDNREIAHRFSVEAKAVAKLRHPNIVEVFDISSEDDTEQYLVVELVRGPTLRKLLQERGALPPEIAAAFVMELLSGVAHAHASGVVHRDVKPENVLVEHRPRPSSTTTTNPGSGPLRGETPLPRSQPGSTKEPSSAANAGERVAVKLTDFGIAKLLDAQGVTSTGQVLGSPAHMAPEQIEGGDVDGRADVFGLGVLMYECMVGHLPFLGNNPAQVLRRVLDGVYASAEREKPTVGKIWSDILDHALARKAASRFPDALAMRDAISAELARLGMGAPRVEIEAWLDDPLGWTTAHEKRLVDRLCELGAASRKRSEAVAAAADYNRALAFSPNNPALLRIVASMHRSEARARLIRSLAPLVLGACVLGGGAYFVAKSLKGEIHGGDHDPVSTTTAEPSASAALARPSATASSRPSVPSGPSVSATTTASAAPARTLATPTVAPKAGVERKVSFRSVHPSFGVHMTIDGAPGPDPDPRTSFPLDEKAHTLVFTCTGDLCTPMTVKVDPGPQDISLPVELQVPPARIVVDGDSSHSYGIEELPNLILTNGQEAEVAMTAGTRGVIVFDRIDPANKQSVTLRAGKREVVQLKPH
jgi:serine/threonine-protein kinase